MKTNTIKHIITTTALVMGAFFIGKITTPTEKTVTITPIPETETMSTKDYIAVNDIKTIDYYANENKLTINTSTDSYDFVPIVNVIPSETETTETETDNICKIYNSSDLTEDILANRQGKLIIEKCTGTVSDDEKNGVLEDGSYISYEDVDCAKGDTITTYLIYNPDTNYTDDVVERFDFVQ